MTILTFAQPQGACWASTRVHTTSSTAATSAVCQHSCIPCNRACYAPDADMMSAHYRINHSIAAMDNKKAAKLLALHARQHILRRSLHMIPTCCTGITPQSTMAPTHACSGHATIIAAKVMSAQTCTLMCSSPTATWRSA